MKKWSLMILILTLVSCAQNDQSRLSGGSTGDTDLPDNTGTAEQAAKTIGPDGECTSEFVDRYMKVLKASKEAQNMIEHNLGTAQEKLSQFQSVQGLCDELLENHGTFRCQAMSLGIHQQTLLGSKDLQARCLQADEYLSPH